MLFVFRAPSLCFILNTVWFQALGNNLFSLSYLALQVLVTNYFPYQFVSYKVPWNEKVIRLAGTRSSISTSWYRLACDLKIKIVMCRILKTPPGQGSESGFLKTVYFLQPFLFNGPSATKIEVPRYRQCKIKDN